MKTLRSVRAQAAVAACAGLATPAALAVGGDTCATATVVSQIPYFDTGSTCGFQDDYDRPCPFDSSASPDVVYVFSPTETTTVEISLCAGSDYDTRLIVYDGTCAGLAPCNDDYCSTPNMLSPVVSRAAVAMWAGVDYFIVVDGSGGACGNYTIEILEAQPPDCPPNTIFDQPPHSPHDDWQFGVSDYDFCCTSPPNANGMIRYENFAVSGPICGLHWGGILAHNALALCDEDPMDFNIVFLHDDAGLPGDVACEYWVTAEAEPTGIYYLEYQMFRWEVDLQPLGCCDLEEGWISIVGASDPACWFWWGSASSGDGTSLRDETNGEGIQTEPYDRAVCMVGPITGRCCYDGCPWDCGDPPDGVVNVVDFLALLGQWNQLGVSCDFDHDGVTVVDFLTLLSHWGACPTEPACAVTTVNECEVLGGQWTEGVSCDVPCP
jgi:hypothetical protein